MGTEVLKLEDKWKASINEALSLFNIDDNIQVGILTLEPNTRLPEEGLSVHGESHEFAYVIEGKVCIGTEDGEKVIEKGDLAYNTPGTEHYTINKTGERAKVLWFLSPPFPSL